MAERDKELDRKEQLWCAICDWELDPDCDYRDNTLVCSECMNTKFVLFTKRTNNPKLAWLERKLEEAGIAFKRTGESYHAPILRVLLKDERRAWQILDPVDDILDDDPRFDQN